MNEEVCKEIRDWLRESDILIARLQTAKPLTKAEETLVDSYTSRIKSVLAALKGWEMKQTLRDIQDRSPLKKQ